MNVKFRLLFDFVFFFCMQKTAYEMRISDWSSDVCSSDLLVATGRLGVGDAFVHESYIGSRFIGRVEAETMVGDLPAIVPSIEGSAIATGLNTIWIDRDDVFWKGFQIT